MKRRLQLRIHFALLRAHRAKIGPLLEAEHEPLPEVAPVERFALERAYPRPDPQDSPGLAFDRLVTWGSL